VTLSPFSGVVEDFDLASIRTLVSSMPDIEGAWPKPASLTRLNVTSMPWKMMRRFEKKIIPYNMGYKPDPTSVWARFDEPCWIWQGGLHPKGYGRFWLGIDPVSAEKMWAYTHRLAFEHWVAIPKPGYIVDHECEVKTCCNPVHLWPVSNIENLRLANIRRPWQRRNQYSKE
jgi:hypothetical protein